MTPERTWRAYHSPPDIRGLHDWPPFFRIGFLQSAQGLGRPSFGRENLNSEIEEPRSHRWIGERPRNSCVETANNLIRCALGREKSSPTGTRHRRQSHLRKGRNVGCNLQAPVARHRVGFYAPSPDQRQISHIAEIKIDLTGYQVLYDRATVGHKGTLNAVSF